MIREPAVAGSFYPESPEELKDLIEKCIKDGPGEKLKKKDVLGVISPHAGYTYSGVGAAYAHMALAGSGYPKTLILLGPAHMIGDNSVWLGSDWATPLGKVEVDRELGRKIADNSLFDLSPDPHINEHSLEVQLPFIQYICEKYNIKLPKIVPIVFSLPLNLDVINKFGEAIYAVIRDRNVKLLVSSDFTHYGPRFDYVPFTEGNIKEKIYDLDREAIKKIEEMDLKGFVDYVNTTKATICGSFPIAVAMSISKNFGIKKGKLLNYSNSGDTTNFYSNSVSYAAIEL